MNKILSEKDFQKYFLNKLQDENDYIIRDGRNYNRDFAMDKELVFQFLNTTQPEKINKLRK